MPSVGGVRRRLEALKPVVVPTFVVFITARESPVPSVDDEFQIVEVRRPDDPLLPKLTSSKRQLRVARQALEAGDWDILAALKDGEPVGRLWESGTTERRFFSGVPRFRLADDEIFLFDLFVEKEYRRSSVAFTMADYFFRKYAPGATDKHYAYGFISYDNVPSILWHHANGFTIVQTVNMLHIGESVKWRLPFSDVPRFGPLSKKGRYTDPDKELFGPALMP